MSSVDERITKLTLENKDFEKNAKQTIKTTEELKEAMKFKNTTEALETFSKQLTNIEKSSATAESALTKMSNRTTTIFGKLFDSLQNLVVSKAKSFANSIVTNVTNPITQAFAQIESGGWSRASNIKDAEFQLKGLGVTGQKLAKVMEDVNYGVSGTAYGLDAAAKAASQLTASSVQAGDEMKAALRGISGVAAMTNSTYEDISSIFTTVAGNGKLMTQQLRQFSFRGLNAAATLGKQLGKTEAEINEMVSKGQIDFKTFSKAMDDAFGEHAKDANETYSGSLANMKAALSRLGVDVANAKLETMVGVFNACREAINSLHKQFQPFIDTLAKLTTIKNRALQGLVESFTEIDKSGTRVMKTGLRLKEMAEGISRIIWNLRSVTYAFQLGLKDVLGEANPLVKVIGSLSGGINTLSKTTQPTADQLVAIRNAARTIATPFTKLGEAISWVNDKAHDLIDLIKNSEIVQAIISATSPYITKLSGDLVTLKNSIGQLSFSSTSFNRISKSVTKLIGKIKTLASQSAALNAIKEKLSSVTVEGVVNGLVTAVGAFVGVIKQLTSAITNSKVWNNIKPFVINVLSFLDEKLASLISKGGTIFSNLKNNTNVLSTVGRVIGNIKSVVSSILPYISNGAKYIASMAASLLGFKQAVEPVNDILQETVTIVDNPVALAGPNSTVQHFVDLTNTVDESVSKKGLLERIKDFGERMKEMFSNMGIGYKQNEKSIKDGFNMLKAVSWYLVGFISWMSIIKQVNATTKVMKSASGMLDNIGNAFKTFADKVQHPFSNITNITNNIKNVGMNTPILLQLSAVILSLTAAVELLGRMDTNDLKKGSIAVGGLTALMGTIAILLKMVTVKVIPVGQQFKSSGVAMTITSLALSMLTIAAAIKMLENVNMSSGIIDNLIVLGGTLTVLGVVTAKMSALSGTHQLKSAVIILTLALALKTIAKTLVQMTNDLEGISWDTMWKTLTALGAAIATIVIIGLGMSKVAFGGAVGLIAIILAASKIADIINKLLLNLDWDSMKAKIIQYQDILLDIAKLGAIFAVVAYMLGPNIDKFSNGMVKLAVSVALMAALGRILKGMEDSDINHALIMFRETAAMLGLLLLELAAIQFFVGSFDYKGINKVIKQISKFFLSLTVLSVLIGIIPTKIFDKGRDALIEFSLMLGALMLCTTAARGVDPKTLKAIAVNLVVMLTSILVIAFIPWTMLLKGLVSIGVMCGSLALVFRSLKNVKKSYDKSVWKVLAMAVAGLVAVAGALYLLSDIPASNLGAAMGALIITFGVLSSVLKSLLKVRHNASNILKVRDIFLLSIALLTEVTGALYVLSLADPVNLSVGMIALNATLLVLSKCISTMMGISYSKNNIKKVGAILLLAGGLLAEIAAALAIVANAASWKQLVWAMVAIDGVLIAFGAVISIMKILGGSSSGVIAKAGAIVLAGLSLIEIAAALRIVASIGDIGLMLTAMVAIDGVLIAFGAVLATMSVLGTNVTGALAGAGSMVLAGAALFEIATALWMVAKAGDFNQIIGAMIAIDGVLVAFGAVVAVMSILGTNVVGALVGAGSIVLAGLVLFEIGAVLGKLAQYDWQNLEAAGDAVTKTLLALTAAVTVMGLLGPIALVGAGILDAVALVFGVGMVAVLDAIGYIYSQTSYVNEGINAIKLIAAGIGEAIGAFVEGITTSAMNAIDTIADELVLFGQKFTLFSAHLKVIEALNPDWSIVGNILKAIVETMGTGLLADLEEFVSSKLFGERNGLQSTLEKIRAAITTMVGITSSSNYAALSTGVNTINQFEANLDAISNIADKYSDMSNVISFSNQMKSIGDLGIAEFTNSLALADVSTPVYNLFTAIQNAVDFNKTIATDPFKTIGTDMVDAIKEFYTDFYDSGVYLIDGLILGLGDDTSKSLLASAASALGSLIDTTFRDEMGIHSPSVTMQEDGSYLIQGLAYGISDNGSLVVKSIAQLGDKVDTKTKKEIYNIARHAKKEGKTGVSYIYDETEKQVKEGTADIFDTFQATIDQGFTDTKKAVKKEIASSDLGEYADVIEDKMDIIVTVMNEAGIDAGNGFITNLVSSLENNGGDFQAALKETFTLFTNGSGIDLEKLFENAGSSAEDASDSVDDFTSSVGAAGKASSDAAEKANILAEYNWIVAKASKSVNSAFGVMSDTISDTSKDLSGFGVNFDKIAEVMYNASRTGTEAFDDMFAKSEATLDDFRSKVVETFKSIISSFEDTFDMMSSVDNPFDGMLTGKQMIRNLQDQAAQVASVGTKLTRLAMKGINTQLIQELAEGGASSLTQINSLLRASSEEIRDINALYLGKTTYAQMQAIQTVNAMAIAAQRDIYEAQAETGDATAKVLLLYSDLQADAVEYLMEYADRYEYASSMMRSTVQDGISTFEEFDTTVEKSAADFVKNMWSQVEGARQWEANLEKIIAMGASDDLINALVEKGLDGGYEIAAALASGTVDQIASANEAMIAQKSIPDELANKFGSAYGLAGNASGEKFLNDFAALLMSDPDGKILESCGIMAADTCQALKQQLIAGDVENVNTVAKSFLSGMATKFVQEGRIPEKAAEKMGLKVIKGTGDFVNERNGRKEGDWFTQGVYNGVEPNSSWAQAAIAAAAETGRRIAAALHEALGNGSPSKIAKQEGIWFEQGLVIGLKSMAETVDRTAREVTNPVVEGLREAMNASSNILSNDGFNPTITPVLDLSEIQNGSNLLANMLNTSMSIKGNMSFGTNVQLNSMSRLLKDAIKEGLNDLEINHNVNYTQNNYSPKELSSIDIYRQTKNQLSALKGALQ